MALYFFLGGGFCYGGDDFCCDEFYSPGNPFECTTHDGVGRPQDRGNCTWWAYFKAPNISQHNRAGVWLEQIQRTFRTCIIFYSSSFGSGGFNQYD